MIEEAKLKSLRKEILNHPVMWCVDFGKYCKFYCWLNEDKHPHVCLLDEDYTNNMLTCPNKLKEAQGEVK